MQGILKYDDIFRIAEYPKVCIRRKAMYLALAIAFVRKKLRRNTESISFWVRSTIVSAETREAKARLGALGIPSVVLKEFAYILHAGGAFGSFWLKVKQKVANAPFVPKIQSCVSKIHKQDNVCQF